MVKADASFTGYVSQMTVSWSWGINVFKWYFKNFNSN
jgi:hypothetical protein